ncbi:UNVERIFIED_CONTAM: hypothetical protein FKN15_020511 [Acipenser sinensis]
MSSSAISSELAENSGTLPAEGAVVSGLDTADSKPEPRGYQHSILKFSTTTLQSNELLAFMLLKLTPWDPSRSCLMRFWDQ